MRDLFVRLLCCNESLRTSYKEQRSGRGKGGKENKDSKNLHKLRKVFQFKPRLALPPVPCPAPAASGARVARCVCVTGRRLLIYHCKVQWHFELFCVIACRRRFVELQTEVKRGRERGERGGALFECLIQAYQTSPKSPRPRPRQQLIKFAVSECCKLFKTLPPSLPHYIRVCLCQVKWRQL